MDPGQNNPELVVFDFDGCLVDSTSIAVECHRESLSKFGIQLNEAEIHAGLGLDALDTISRLAGRHHEVEKLQSSPERLNAALALNAELLAASDDAPVFPLVPLLLQLLSDQNTAVAIYSSSNRARITRILRSNKLDRFVDDSLVLSHHDLPTLVSSSLDGPLKPKPSGDGLKHLLHKAKLSADRAVFIGDRPEDSSAAEDAGIPFLFAGWSGTAIPPANTHIRVNNLLDLWAVGLIDIVHPRVSDLVRAHLRRDLVAFVGAGFSLEAGFDDWSALVARVTGECNDDQIPAGDMTKLVSYYMGARGIAAVEHASAEIWDSLWPAQKPLQKHKILRSLGLGRIWTTNYDPLLEYAASPYQLVTEDKDLTPIHSATQIVKLNGSVHSVAAPIVLSASDFADLFSRRPELFGQLSVDVMSKSVLFIGTSLGDTLTQRLLERVRAARSRRGSVPLDYAIVKGPLNQETLRLEREYGVVAIDVPDWSGIEHILTVLKWKSRQHSVIISGSVIGPELDDTEREFLQTLGYLLAAAGFIIRIGNGPQVARDVLCGAARCFDDAQSSYLHRTRIIRYNRRLVKEDFVDTCGHLTEHGDERLERLLLDLGAFRFVRQSHNDEDVYEQLRREMCSDGDVMIAVGGYSDKQLVAESIRNAMLAERDLVQSAGGAYLPVPFIRGVGRQLYEDLRTSGINSLQGEDVQRWTRALGGVEEAKQAARLVVAIVKLLAARRPHDGVPMRGQ